MIVVDASAFTTAVAYADERGSRARATLAQDLEWSAPDHWKAEVFSALRGLVLGGKLTQEQGARAVFRLRGLAVDQVSLDGLLLRMWELRAAVSGYDAAYVALAQERGATLVTADAKLARTAIAYCRVDLTG